MESMELLKKHLAEYPLMEIRDAEKLLYQRNFGCGHLVTDSAHSLNRIKEEYETLRWAKPDRNPKPDSGAKSAGEKISKKYHEELGNGLSRLYLDVMETGITAETINQMFINTAGLCPGGTDGLEQELEILERMCGRGQLPFSEHEAKDYRAQWKSMGYPAVSHSQRYRDHYRPAYRLVKSRYIPYLQVFARIDQMMASKSHQGSMTIAIDGPCASGKTTLGELLKEVYDCNVFHMDDFFLQPHQRTKERLEEPGGNVDYERFSKEVLGNLENPDGVTFQRYDCSLGRLEETVHAPKKELNIVEGAYSQHPYFGECYDLRFYLETEEEIQRDRILKRNGAVMLERFQNEWIPMEKLYFQTFQIKEKSIFVKSLVDKENFV